MDTIDLVQLHCPPSEVIDDDATYDVLDRLVDEGVIAAYGVSVETAAQALSAIARPHVASVQIILNAFRMKPLDEVLPAAAAAGVGIIARVPLASGLLSGKYDLDTTFAEDDHRTYNRDGSAFDVGETFAGVDYEIGVEAAREFSELVASSASTPRRHRPPSRGSGSSRASPPSSRARGTSTRRRRMLRLGWSGSCRRPSSRVCATCTTGGSGSRCTLAGRSDRCHNPFMTNRAHPGVDAYIAKLPEWQQSICEQLREIIWATDPEIEETIKRTVQPYFVLEGNVCALLATKDHVNLFLYDPTVSDPAGVINQGHDNLTARSIQIYEDDEIDRDAITGILGEIVEHNRQGGWRRLPRS